MIRGRASRIVCVTVAFVAAACLPSIATANSTFDAGVRYVTAVTARRVSTTEKKLPSRTFTYCTTGSTWSLVGPQGWTGGYFPGELWTEYALTGDSWFKSRAASRQAAIGKSVIDANSTDIGIRWFYTYAHAFEQTGNSAYRTQALRAAKGEAARFNRAAGVVRSRNTAGTCQVVIDELMNLQILYWGTENGGPASWRDIAHRHALTVARDFVRADGSVVHIIDYNPTTGAVVKPEAGQGYSTTSMWARGQAWAIHGFATAYRKTLDPLMLATARKVADRYLTDAPADTVPYWDFRDPSIPNAPRDSAAAAVAASGLLDLATSDPDPANRARYADAARATLANLVSPTYLSMGANPALLLHGTMNWWNPATRDVGQSFGDYFLLEAIQRLRTLPPETPALPIARVRASKGNPQAAVDGNFSTPWTSTGNQWLELDLGAMQPMQAASIAVRSGWSRSASFKLYVSNDRKWWGLVTTVRSSGETALPETYTFTPTNARYLRIVCSGTSRDSANGILEASVH